jgi:competence protein ComFC
MFQPLVDGFRDILFPRNCILCRQYIAEEASPHLCSRCYASIEFNAPPFCLRCSRHLDVFTTDGVCPTCLKYPILFDSAWGAVTYNPTSQKLLHLFKYAQKTAVRTIFTRLLDQFLDDYGVSLTGFDYLVPVPLHSVRARERGFNQARLLAEGMRLRTGIPVLNALQRVHPTKVQAFLGQKERWTNLQGAFTINRSFNINNKSILLVDDLLTTGATASAAAYALKDAGASNVGLLVAALAP